MYGGKVHAKVLAGNSKRQRPFGRPRLEWEDNFKVDLKYRKVWTGFTWLRSDTNQRWALVSTEMNLYIPSNEKNFLPRWETSSYWRRILLHGVSWLLICHEASVMSTYVMLVPLTEGWKLLTHDQNSKLFITTLQNVKVEVKVKFTLEQATKAQRGSRIITLLFL
jgi:hypothetical protein